jgi:hypothetical protein
MELGGMSKGIAPILYAYPDSSLTSRMVSMLGHFGDEHLPQKVRETLADDFYDMWCFIKPYEGDLWRPGGLLADVRFYNEREWRFVPILPKEFYRYGMMKADFLKDDVRREANEKLAELSRISFEPSNIK